VRFELDCGARVSALAAVLALRSRYFRALLAGGFGEAAHVGREARVPVRVRGVSEGAFRAALHFLYSGGELPAATRR
jgi:hypothetical protein